MKIWNVSIFFLRASDDISNLYLFQILENSWMSHIWKFEMFQIVFFSNWMKNRKFEMFQIDFFQTEWKVGNLKCFNFFFSASRAVSNLQLLQIVVTKSMEWYPKIPSKIFSPAARCRGDFRILDTFWNVSIFSCVFQSSDDVSNLYLFQILENSWMGHIWKFEMFQIVFFQTEWKNRKFEMFQIVFFQTEWKSRKFEMFQFFSCALRMMFQIYICFKF